MPIDLIPTFERRPARFERYEDFVSEVADVANAEAKAFIVGVKECQVVAVNLLNERGNAATFMHNALRKPAVQAELEGGYERFLASIAETGHRGKQHLVAAALAKEREWGVPLRGRRILDVDNFLERNKPIPAFSEEAYAPVFGWSLSSANSPNAAVPKSQAMTETDSHSATPSTAASSIASALPDRAGAWRQQPTTAATAHPSNRKTVQLPRARTPVDHSQFLSGNPRDHRGLTHGRYANEVRLWAVPMEIDAGKLAEAWQATVSARFPPPPQTETADAAPGPDDRQTALRRHLHEGFGQVVAGLRNRVDPRPALAELYRQAIVLGGREDSPESLLIAACADDYNGLLNRLSTGLATVFPFGYPNAPLRQVPMQDTRRAGAEDLDAPAGQQPFDVAVCQGLVPPSIDASALSAAWRECAGRKLPAFPESGPDVSFENRLVREHFHDAVFSAARHLEMGIDPRPALLHFQDQIAGLSASTDHAEFRELFRMCVNYRHILKTARPVERQSS